MAIRSTGIKLGIFASTVAAVVLGTDVVKADIVYLSQSRGVMTTTCQGTSEVIAPDFKPFEASLPMLVADATQQSLLDPTLMLANGLADGWSDNGCQGEGVSFFKVTFQLTAPTPYSLQGELGVYCQNGSTLAFTGPGLAVSYSTPANPGGPAVTPISEGGVLPPGIYTLEAKAHAIWGEGACSGGGAQFDFFLNFGEALCAADCDASGSLTIDDFVCFQTLFALGDPFADCDADGVLLIDDFICFQTAFAVGC